MKVFAIILALLAVALSLPIGGYYGGMPYLGGIGYGIGGLGYGIGGIGYGIGGIGYGVTNSIGYGIGGIGGLGYLGMPYLGGYWI